MDNEQASARPAARGWSRAVVAVVAVGSVVLGGGSAAALAAVAKASDSGQGNRFGGPGQMRGRQFGRPAQLSQLPGQQPGQQPGGSALGRFPRPTWETGTGPVLQRGPRASSSGPVGERAPG